VGHGEPWGSLGWGGEWAEGGFPRRAGSAVKGARRWRGSVAGRAATWDWRGSVGDEEACQGVVVGGGWPEGYSPR
jgi:hypothetical protein